MEPATAIEESCGEPARVRPDPRVIVVFGGTGDLARRKLWPALYHLAREGLLPDSYRIIGSSVEELSTSAFRGLVRGSLEEYCRCDVTEELWSAFADTLSYLSGAFGPDSPTRLQDAVETAEAETDAAGRLFYMAVPPAAAGPIIEGLGVAELNERSRVIMEKPFGVDLDSARELNASVHEVFDESQIYRIDHFLGKETVQNILALRFANGLFEPVWNREHVDHVQIDVPETLSIEMRAAFYEATGALRDMIVTHLFQVMSFVALEPPTSLDPKPLIDEKVKVFQAMMPLRAEDVVRGQYEGYRDEPGVALNSETETFVAVRAEVDNWRWAGVPFFLRSGKRLGETRRTITITFREPPRQMFAFARPDLADMEPNKLVFEVGAPEGISMSFLSKTPGPRIELGPARMAFQYEQGPDLRLLEAYERLIHDALIGDQTLFTRADGIERLWEVVTPVLEDPPPLHPYDPGSWGPDAASELVSPRRWHLPEALS